MSDSLKELHELHAGRLLMEIGKGEYRSALWMAMQQAMEAGYQRGLKANAPKPRARRKGK